MQRLQIPPSTRSRSIKRTAFTFVEMVIVVLILGIVAALTVGRFTDIQDEVIENSLSANLKVMRDQIDIHSVGKGFPDTLDPNWFIARSLPPHPQNRGDVPTLQLDKVPGKLNPNWKVLKTGAPGAYWYNSAEGIIRVRVAPLATAKETLEMYNRINGTQETALGNFSGGGGAS